MAPDVKKRFKSRVIITVFGGVAALTVAATPALANDHNLHTGHTTQHSTAHLDITGRAITEARKNGGMGLIIAHGRITSDPRNEITSPQEYSDGLEQALSAANIKLQTYYIPTPGMEDNAMSVTLTNGHTSHGPMRPDVAQKDMGNIVQEYYRYRDLFSNVP